MRYLIYYLFIILMVLTGCKSKDSQEQEVQKLLDRQTELKVKQEQSLDQIREVQDSLKREKKMLLEERNSKNREVETMRKNQKVLMERLNSEEQTEVASEKQKLQGQISAYEDSIKNLKASLDILETDIDSLQQTMKVYGIQEGKVEEAMQTGISEIDTRITKLEDRKLDYSERARILKERISVFDKKIEAYDMERSLYVDERDKLLRSNASDKQLAPYIDRISRLDSVLEEQTRNQDLLRDELAQVNRWISDTDELIEGLKTKIENQYDRTGIVESYIESEKQRLEHQLAELRKSRENLVSEQDLISRERTRLEHEIASLDRKMELIKSREMSDILELQANLQESDASLTGEEIRSIQKDSEMTPEGEQNMGENEELNEIVMMGAQLDSLQASIEQEKQEILKTRFELAQQRAEVAKKRAAFGRAMGTVILVLVIGGLAIVSLFYFLGRRKRTAP